MEFKELIISFIIEKTRQERISFFYIMGHDEKIYVSVLFLGSLLFAQDALREAVNNADFDAVRQMVKKNEIEEVIVVNASRYCITNLWQNI
jgi:hypothetical protein